MTKVIKILLFVLHGQFEIDLNRTLTRTVQIFTP
jgi:hypothetical protein